MYDVEGPMKAAPGDDKRVELMRMFVDATEHRERLRNDQRELDDNISRTTENLEAIRRDLLSIIEPSEKAVAAVPTMERWDR